MKRKTFLQSLAALTAMVISNPVKLFAGKKTVPENKIDDGAALKPKEKVLGTQNVYWTSCTTTIFPKNRNKFISEYRDNDNKLVAIQKVKNGIEIWKYFNNK